MSSGSEPAVVGDVDDDLIESMRERCDAELGVYVSFQRQMTESLERMRRLCDAIVALCGEPPEVPSHVGPQWAAVEPGAAVVPLVSSKAAEIVRAAEPAVRRPVADTAKVEKPAVAGRGGHRPKSIDYAEVARVASEALVAGRPQFKAVQELLGGSASSARNALQRARRLGHRTAPDRPAAKPKAPAAVVEPDSAASVESRVAAPADSDAEPVPVEVTAERAPTNAAPSPAVAVGRVPWTPADAASVIAEVDARG